MTKQAVFLATKRYFGAADVLYKEEKDDDTETVPYFDDFVTTKDDLRIKINTKNCESYLSTFQNFNQFEWADTMNSVIFEYFGLPCCWIFNRHKNIMNEIVAKGKCSTTNCAGTVRIYSENNHTSLTIIIQSAKPEVDHLRKRSTKYERKKTVEELLKSNSAASVNSILANRILHESDQHDSSQIISPGTLRTQKSRANQHQSLDNDEIISLRLLKNEMEYFDSIHDLGLDPFHVVYFTQVQRQLLLTHTARKKCILSIDATGLNLKKPKLSSYSSEKDAYKSIFLYEIYFKSDEVNFPIFHFLSQRHTSDFIQYMLASFKHYCFGKKNPDEIVMDNSSALLLASVQCFTSCKTMHGYLDCCFGALFENKPPPECFIRTDRAHNVKLIKTMKCFEGYGKKKRKLIQRVLGTLILTNDIKKAEEIIVELFILLGSKYVTTELTAAKQCLKDFSGTEYLNETNEKDNFYEIEDECILGGSTKMHKWIDDLYEKAKTKMVSPADDHEDNVMENAYRNKKMIKELKRFLVQIVLFSNVMLESFQSKNTAAVTCASEAGFKVVKHDIFNNINGMRVDKFVARHLDYLKGISLQKKVNTKHLIDKPDKSEESTMSCVYQENWGNRNEDSKIVRDGKRILRGKSTESKVQSESQKKQPSEKIQSKKSKRSQHSIINTDVQVNRNVPILKNGGKSNLLGSACGSGCSIVTENTCPFDSLLQIYLSCYADFETFAEIINATPCSMAELIRNVFKEGKLTKTYSRRNEIISTICPELKEERSKKVISFNCWMGISTMHLKMCNISVQMRSYRLNKKCSKCDYDDFVWIESIGCDLRSLDISNMQQSLKFKTRTKKKCPTIDCGECLQVFNTLKMI